MPVWVGIKMNWNQELNNGVNWDDKWMNLKGILPHSYYHASYEIFIRRNTEDIAERASRVLYV